MGSKGISWILATLTLSVCSTYGAEIKYVGRDIRTSSNGIDVGGRIFLTDSAIEYPGVITEVRSYFRNTNNVTITIFRPDGADNTMRLVSMFDIIPKSPGMADTVKTFEVIDVNVCPEIEVGDKIGFLINDVPSSLTYIFNSNQPDTLSYHEDGDVLQLIQDQVIKFDPLKYPFQFNYKIGIDVGRQNSDGSYTGPDCTEFWRNVTLAEEYRASLTTTTIALPIGPPGEKGEQGPPGSKGDQGPTGSRGSDGAKGDVGEKGEIGDKGFTGEKGERGDTGVGTPGPQGSQGIQGPPGEDGIDGQKGSRGEQGNSVTGDKGDRGDQGATGQQGSKGDRGDDGSKGEPGQTGAQGNDGAIGLKGDPGDLGPVGPAGPKGEPGQSGSNDGSGKGDKGEKGTTGKVGPPGPPGPAATVSNGTNSNNGGDAGSSTDPDTGASSGASTSIADSILLREPVIALLIVWCAFNTVFLIVLCILFICRRKEGRNRINSLDTTPYVRQNDLLIIGKYNGDPNPYRHSEKYEVGSTKSSDINSMYNPRYNDAHDVRSNRSHGVKSNRSRRSRRSQNQSLDNLNLPKTDALNMSS